MTKALIVLADGSQHRTEIDANSLTTLNEIVGGYIEYIPVADRPDVHAYVNEEGRLIGLPDNPTATKIAGRDTLAYEYQLLGTVVFLGEGEDGEEGDLPEDFGV